MNTAPRRVFVLIEPTDSAFSDVVAVAPDQATSDRLVAQAAALGHEIQAVEADEADNLVLMHYVYRLHNNNDPALRPHQIDGDFTMLRVDDDGILPAAILKSQRGKPDTYVMAYGTDLEAVQRLVDTEWDRLVAAPDPAAT